MGLRDGLSWRWLSRAWPRWPAPPRPRGARAVAASADSFGADGSILAEGCSRATGRSAPGARSRYLTFNGTTLSSRFEPPWCGRFASSDSASRPRCGRPTAPRSTARCRVSRTWPCTSMGGDQRRRRPANRGHPPPQRRDRPVFHVGKNSRGRCRRIIGANRGRAMEPGRLGHHADVAPALKTSPARIRADVHRGRLTTGRANRLVAACYARERRADISESNG